MRSVGLLVILVAAVAGVQPAASTALDGGTGAPLVFEPNPDTGVTTGPDGQLRFGTGSARGFSPDARYTFGDRDAPTRLPAFTLTNAADRAHDVALSYRGPTGDGPGANVRFLVFDADGRHLVTMSEESGVVVISGVDSGETLWGVIVIDTHGLTPAADLSGTLRLHALAAASA